jgi:hypothetical protein
MIENKWNAVPKDVWRVLFRDYFSFSELRNPRLVCRYWNSIILDPIVGDRFMRQENVEKKADESWWRTFSRRIIIIAIDCSASMTCSVTEPWRYNVAIAEVKAIAEHFGHLTATKGIMLMPFASKYEFSWITHVDHISPSMQKTIDNSDSMQGIGGANDWRITYEGLNVEMKLNISNGIRPKVFLLSDFEGAFYSSNLHQIWTDKYDEPPHMHLCRIGNSPEGKSFVETCLNSDLTHFEGQPAVKKIRRVGNLVLSAEHFPSLDGSNREITISRAPTVVIEEEFFNVMDVEDEDDEPLEPTEQSDNGPEYIPEDYKDVNSYADED